MRSANLVRGERGESDSEARSLVVLRDGRGVPRRAGRVHRGHRGQLAATLRIRRCLTLKRCLRIFLTQSGTAGFNSGKEEKLSNSQASSSQAWWMAVCCCLVSLLLRC